MQKIFFLFLCAAAGPRKLITAHEHMHPAHVRMRPALGSKDTSSTKSTHHNCITAALLPALIQVHDVGIGAKWVTCMRPVQQLPTCG